MRSCRIQEFSIQCITETGFDICGNVENKWKRTFSVNAKIEHFICTLMNVSIVFANVSSHSEPFSCFKNEFKCELLFSQNWENVSPISNCEHGIVILYIILFINRFSSGRQFIHVLITNSIQNNFDLNWDNARVLNHLHFFQIFGSYEFHLPSSIQSLRKLISSIALEHSKQ